MSNVGQRERATQNRIVKFFQDEVKYSSIKTATMQQRLIVNSRLINPESQTMEGARYAG